MRITTTTFTQPATGLPREAIPEIGRIGLGIIAKSREGKPYPVATDYFVPRGVAKDVFAGLYGTEPRQLPICFFNDEEELSCSSRLEIRDRKGDLYSYSDGQTYYFRPKNGGLGFTKLIHVDNVPDIAQRTEEFLRQGLQPDKAKLINWQPTLYLRFMIRDFPMVGHWQISTHGAQSSIPQITGVVDTWKGLLGSLCLVPFVLVIKRGKSADKAKQFTYLNLLPAFSWEQARQSALGRDGSLILQSATHVPTALAIEPTIALLTAGQEVADG